MKPYTEQELNELEAFVAVDWIHQTTAQTIWQDNQRKWLMTVRELQERISPLEADLETEDI